MYSIWIYTFLQTVNIHIFSFFYFIFFNRFLRGRWNFQFWFKNKKYFSFHISFSSSHMMGMCLMFLSSLKKDLECYVKSGMCTMHAMKVVVTMVFHLELDGYLEVAWVMYVSRMSASLLSVSTLEAKGYVVTFEDGMYSYVQREHIPRMQ